MEQNSSEKRGNVFALLGILYALLQYIWTYFISLKLKNSGTLASVTSPYGYLPMLFFNFIIALPMIIVFIGSIARYRRDFDDKLWYIKTDRYLLTMILTTIYALMYPMATRVAETPRSGAMAWIYYLVFIAFLEEFLYRGLVPTLVDRSNLPRLLKLIIPALVYGISQSALPFAKYGINRSTLLLAMPDIVWSTIFHFALLSMKKWSGAMWLPIIVHAIVDLSFYFIF